MKFLAIIPARGGSKGIPKKNIKVLHNKPLIQYTIDAAQEVFANADICISSDSSEIIETVERAGLNVPFKRPQELAEDTSATDEVILHAINHYEKCGKHYDAVVLLQPTSPLRAGQQIKEAISLYKSELDMVVSVKKTNSNPYYVLFEENKEGYLEKSKQGNFIRRQDCPDVWEYNGAIYVINVQSIKKTPILNFTKIVKYEMDEWNSYDIDTHLDWHIVETLLSSKLNRC